MNIDPILKEIYREKDISTNIAIFLASLMALIMYIFIKDVFVSMMMAISFFSLSKLLSISIISKNHRRKNEQNIIKSFSQPEKEVIQTFIANGTSYIALSDLRNGEYDFDNKAFDSLVTRGVIDFQDRSMGDGPSGFQLNIEVYKLFLSQ